MALSDFLKQLDVLAADAEAAFQDVVDDDLLEKLRVAFLGAKNGRLKTVQRGLGKVPVDDKRAAGMRLNEVKNQLQTAFDAAQQRLESPRSISRSGSNRLQFHQHVSAQVAPGVAFDPTLPGTHLRVGRLHPITQTIEELKDIMGRLGFTPAEGPEIEDERHNFEALNIPREHPARDPLDNFYLATARKSGAAGGPGTLLLRSQTSTVQIRVMEETSPPVRIISLGRVYRPDTADATHYPMFHQMEGLWIDRQVTMADLKTVLRMFASNYLGSEVDVRFRPSFFPFTEPSVEADYHWNDGWVEFGGAGMVDPNVLRDVGYDPEEYIGFAFGLGVERLCMRRHNITDIREFYRNDVRFLSQF